jgi:hypothetical protein
LAWLDRVLAKTKRAHESESVGLRIETSEDKVENYTAMAGLKMGASWDGR